MHHFAASDLSDGSSKGKNERKPPNDNSPRQQTASDDLSSTIPLYRGDIDKRNLSFSNRSKDGGKNRELPRKKKRNNASSANNNNNKKQSTLPHAQNVVQSGKAERSYLVLFHSRIGYPSSPASKKVSVASETARAVDGDETFRTATSVESGLSEEIFQDAQEHESDSESFYATHLQEIKEQQQHKQKTVTGDLRASATAASLTETAVSHFHSVSEQVLSPRKFVSRLHRHRNGQNEALGPPVMGKLGPDIEAVRAKQEALKKRQSYGRKVSENNRIKIMEEKLAKMMRSENESL